MPRVMHFEIHAQDPERAARFYSQLFGWEITKWAGPVDYWLIRSGPCPGTGPSPSPGIDGGLLRRQGPPPAEGQSVNAYVCTVGVEKLDEYLGRLPAAGGSVALPKMAVPGVGWLAYAKDPEGNIFGMLQPDQQAK
jgi:predicted enzyme related to lactoylglutathione lyase